MPARTGCGDDADETDASRCSSVAGDDGVTAVSDRLPADNHMRSAAVTSVKKGRGGGVGASRGVEMMPARRLMRKANPPGAATRRVKSVV